MDSGDLVAQPLLFALNLGALDKERIPVVLAVLAQLAKACELFVESAKTASQCVTLTRHHVRTPIQLSPVRCVQITGGHIALQLGSYRVLNSLATDCPPEDLSYDDMGRIMSEVLSKPRPAR